MGTGDNGRVVCVCEGDCLAVCVCACLVWMSGLYVFLCFWSELLFTNIIYPLHAFTFSFFPYFECVCTCVNHVGTKICSHSHIKEHSLKFGSPQGKPLNYIVITMFLLKAITV